MKSINQSMNRWAIIERWVHQRASVLVFWEIKREQYTVKLAIHGYFLAAPHQLKQRLHWRMPLSVLHIISIPTVSSKRCFQFVQVLLPGRHWPRNVKGSNFISNLIDRCNGSVAGGLAFTPQVLLSPLNYPRALDWWATALYFPEAGYFSLSEFPVYNQP